MTDESLAQFLGRRQKRLLYWRDAFSQPTISREATEELRPLLETYAQLLVKLGSSGAPDPELRSRILQTDRELTAAFEERRLATSPMNSRATATTSLGKPRG